MTDDSYETAERRPRPFRNALIVALLAFVIGAVAVTWALTQWEPARRLIVPATTASPTTRPLTTAPAPAPVATLTSVPAAPVTPEAVAVTESRVAGLEARLAQIDAQAANASNNAARAEGLLIAFAVRRAIDRGVGLGYLEGQLRERFAESQPRAVAAIISAAQAPVTLDMLRQQLDALAPSLAGGGPDESWGSAIQRTMGGLFVVRKASSPSPAADDRLARARLALDGGQADTALAEIARLPSRAAATDWMAAARRYSEAHRALDILEAAALTAPQSVSPATTGTTPQ
ncbi:hypothetical protein [Sphingomonas sp. SUN039]|uniref:hypothetical protein n=1 Tax=Sphingomonas sp. SUN039 TaxID=2937787 RepID=UPI002164AB28|nr:hypothetical protein [Sphingomonas sp. SUN039]UVO55039.1 hypothetical protein M0209_13195 [Sphingomonas sp. SUN039]